MPKPSIAFAVDEALPLLLLDASSGICFALLLSFVKEEDVVVVLEVAASWFAGVLGKCWLSDASAGEAVGSSLALVVPDGQPRLVIPSAGVEMDGDGATWLIVAIAIPSKIRCDAIDSESMCECVTMRLSR